MATNGGAIRPPRYGWGAGTGVVGVCVVRGRGGGDVWDGGGVTVCAYMRGRFSVGEVKCVWCALFYYLITRIIYPFSFLPLAPLSLPFGPKTAKERSRVSNSVR